MAGLASSCSDDEASGPLTFESYELVLDSQQHDPYFTVEVCADDDQPAQVTISAVKGRVVRGAKPSSLSFAVAWSDGPRFASVFGGRQPLPDAYVPVVGAKGTISTCDDGHVSAALAVAFPHVSDQPMSARNVTVDYDIDGHHYVGEAAVLFAQCPIGEVATENRLGGRLCRPEHGRVSGH